MVEVVPGIERAIDSIRVGRRYRVDLGDIDTLAASIGRLGLIQPITITPDGVLVCGQRRLEALKRLGHRTVRAWVRSGISSDLTLLLAQRDDVATVKPLTVLEKADLYREAKAVFEEDAARRQAATRFGTTPHAPDHGDDARGDVVAGGGGSGETPEPHGHLDSRHKAAHLVGGTSGYKRYEQIAWLTDLREDTTGDVVVREHAGEALRRIQAGAPVGPLYERVRREVAGIVTSPRPAPAPSRPAYRAGRPRPPAAHPARVLGPRAGTIRQFLDTITALDGWTERFDADAIGRGMSEVEWGTFDRVREAFDKFAVVARAGREAADAHRVRP
ncbi:chromosome partitioning protein ParB [Xylanimonas allomyrinae]|uniref:Chromosome partitioning protein ParB n=1 Tax=Xylanimonas allomyrinae TaxID=2509459 RepID=A0A4P6END8_9MICO|nr:ParB N-terminal domain-containing protein [Xylanimonas allomyrinae]QAY63233.1 chromosome partitioning protein ParB [Xylanimonas allomyrinae]